MSVPRQITALTLGFGESSLQWNSEKQIEDILLSVGTADLFLVGAEDQKTSWGTSSRSALGDGPVSVHSYREEAFWA